MNRLILILMFLTIGNALMAQDAKMSMNDIKSNPNYLYATGTSMTSGEEASQNAVDLLNVEIEDWLKQRNEQDVAGYVAKSQEQHSMIKTQRGNLFRVFVYVHKADVLPYYEEEKVISVPLGTSDKESPIDTLMNSSMNEIIPQPEEVRYTPTEKEREMLDVTTFNMLNDYINAGRESGDIQQLGKYSTLPSRGLIYVFIHNRNGEIPACLKVQDGEALNLATGKKDVITDYKGCGAIWVMFK